MYRKPLFERLIAFQPIFPSTIFLSRSFFDRVGRWNEAVNRKVSMDLEMHLRCVMLPPIGVITTPTVGIRKHDGNYSGDLVAMLCGDCEMLEYSLNNHAAATRYRDPILASIAQRRREALSAAFADKRFGTVAKLFHELPPEARSAKDHLRYVTAKLPPPLSNLAAMLLLSAGSLRARAR